MPNDGLDIAGRPPFRDEVGRAERLPDTGGWMRDELFDVDASGLGMMCLRLRRPRRLSPSAPTMVFEVTTWATYRACSAKMNGLC